MKKRFSKIIAMFLAVITCTSVVGCSLFEQKNYLPKDLADSNTLAQSIVLNTRNESERSLLTRVQAIAMVERSVVAIKMSCSTSSGTSSSLASGVIIDNGSMTDNIFYIITCHHVISSGGSITVYVPDTNTRNYGDSDYDKDYIFTGTIDTTIRKFDEVSLIGGDQNRDIAVLKLDVTNTGVSKDDIVCSYLPPESYEMQRGEDVFAIGNPGGSLPMTASNGIISYLDRESAIPSVGYITLMQIDVQTNHGSSGGGLYNYYGELIGITNAGNDSLDGIKYAIPHKFTYSEGGFVDTAKQLLATYYEHFEEQNFGYVTGSWSFGITVSSTSSTATIASVVEGSNAEKAGLQTNDVIVGFSFQKDGYNFKEVVTSKSELENCMFALKKYLVVGDSFNVEFRRGTNNWGGYQTLSTTVNITEQFIFGDTGYRVPDKTEEVPEQQVA